MERNFEATDTRRQFTCRGNFPIGPARHLLSLFLKQTNDVPSIPPSTTTFIFLQQDGYRVSSHQFLLCSSARRNRIPTAVINSPATTNTTTAIFTLLLVRHLLLSLQNLIPLPLHLLLGLRPNPLRPPLLNVINIELGISQVDVVFTGRGTGDGPYTETPSYCHAGYQDL